jgi:hypothetical protein
LGLLENAGITDNPSYTEGVMLRIATTLFIGPRPLAGVVAFA